MVQTLTRKEGAIKRVRTSDGAEFTSEQKLEPDQDSTINCPINERPQSRNDRQDRRKLGSHSSQNDDLPFQEGFPIEEDDTQEIRNPDREIFMVIISIISEIEDHGDNPMGRVDLVDYNSSDYDEYLSDAK